MEFYADKKYIVFPASRHAEDTRLLFFIKGGLVYDIVLPLDYESPEYSFPLDIGRFRGETVRVECGGGREIRIEKRDDADMPYDGECRPYAHFTAKRGWLNDPNGLLYDKGVYHMFYQYNPVGCKWGNMHWGHAVSRELVHWQEKGIALFPDSDGTIFSGSAIIDRENAAGLGQGAMLAFYTCAGDTSEASKGKPFTQNLAYSVDGGATFAKYGALLAQAAKGNRDPKVIRYEPDGSYLMALYLENNEFALYKSKNMLEWAEIQRITLPGDMECPDFFPLAADGNPANPKWVFIGAADRYFIGEFDGRRFAPESGPMRLNYGNASYAAQTWSGVPGRRIRTAFFETAVPGEPYANCMALPQEMSLRTVGGALRLCVWPVKETGLLYAGKKDFTNLSISKDKPFRHKVSSRCCDVTLRIPARESFTLSLFGLEVRYCAGRAVLECMGQEAPVAGEGGFLTIRLVADTLAAEIFADGGSVFMGMAYRQDKGQDTLSVASESPVSQTSIRVAEMEAFWKEP